MNEPLLSQNARQQLEQLVEKPPHALLIVAPGGAGKGTFAHLLASQLLSITAERLTNNAYFKRIAAAPGKSISIEEARDVTHFLLLRTPQKTAIGRVVLIEHASDMTGQAQNALLKTIEEPPVGTTLILTATREQDVLPTVRSRAQVLHLSLPTTVELKTYFVQAGYKESTIDKVLLISDGLPGLAQALLDKDEAHPLVAAATRARDLLQKNTYERLLLVDELSRDRQQWLDTLFIVARMAQINLAKSGTSTVTIKKWHRILKAANEATAQILVSGQSKLVALNFMLGL